MSKPGLDPFAVRLRWRFGENRPLEVCMATVSEVVESIARRCGEESGYTVGHIKALATFPDGGFVRASAISPTRPVDIESGGSPPDYCDEFTVTLAVLVYNLPYTLARQMVSDAAETAARRHGGCVELSAGPAPLRRSQSHNQDRGDDATEPHIR